MRDSNPKRKRGKSLPIPRLRFGLLLFMNKPGYARDGLPRGHQILDARMGILGLGRNEARDGVNHPSILRVAGIAGSLQHERWPPDERPDTSVPELFLI